MAPHTATHPHAKQEKHRAHRGASLRAAVLGADDGIVSVAGLMVGVMGSGAGRAAVLTSGIAGLIAGAMSMAAGEYVSVSSQRDSERSDLDRERRELVEFPEAEQRELTEIYVKRGLDRDLARQVASQLHANDPFEAHVRDELGLDPTDLANPRLASSLSACSFALGAALPLAAAAIVPGTNVLAVVLVALIALAILGVLGAKVGGAAPVRAAARVIIGGSAAMLATWIIGRLLGVVGA